MSRVASSRLLARNVFATPCTAPRAAQWIRCNSSTSNKPGQPRDNIGTFASLQKGSSLTAGLAGKSDLFSRELMRSAEDPSRKTIYGKDILSSLQVDSNSNKEPYHFHIFSHKHNTHITVTDPNRDAIISMSCGNLGLRNAQRKSYDAAYQLAAYVVDKLNQTGVVKKIHALEVVLRGFGPGREAATKVLLGTEGKLLKPLIVRVTDSTRVKFGGTRSQRKRRLG